MDITVHPSVLSGEIKAIPSKSVAHRMIIAAALSNAPTRIICDTTCADIEATVDCLRELGARIINAAGGFLVHPLPRFCHTGESDPAQVCLDCKESGTTFRFLLPIVAALGINAEFTGSPRLAERPMNELVSELTRVGVKIQGLGSFPLFCKGPLKEHEFTLPGNVSSQYISGMLYAATALQRPLRLKVQGKLQSASYVTLTLNTLRSFGSVIEMERLEYSNLDNPTEDDPSKRISSVFHQSGNRLITPHYVEVEGDWSNAAFWLCAAALGTEPIRVTNINPQSSQGDAALLKILEDFGARVTRGFDWVELAPGELHALNLSAADIPDLIPVLSLVAARAHGITKIESCTRLRMKECDRLQATCQALEKLGVRAWTDEDDTLYIEGAPAFQSCTLSSHNDHRMAMMTAVAACVASGPISIQGAQAVEKSYPHFFKDLQQLGGRFDIKEV